MNLNSAEDPFAGLYAEEYSKPQQKPEFSEQVQGDPFATLYAQKTPEEESWSTWARRHLVRQASRVGEVGVGLGGNLYRGLYGEQEQPRESNLAGQSSNQGIPFPFSTFNPDDKRGFARQAFEGLVGELPAPLKLLPTSEELKKASIEGTGGFTAPKNEVEKLGDEVTETATNLLIPTGGGQMSFLRALGSSAFGTALRKGAEVLGAPEWAQNLVKAGGTIGAAMFRPDGARDYADSLYKQAEKDIPADFSLPGGWLLTKFTDLLSKLKLGGHNPNSAPVIAKLEEAVNHIQQNGGQLNVRWAQAFRQAINAIVEDPETAKGAEKLFGPISKQTLNAMTPVRHVYPEYWKNYNNAQEAFGSIAQSRTLSRTINRALKGTPIKSGLGLALTSGAASVAGKSIAPAAVLGGSFAFLKGAELMARVVQSPALRGHYLGLLQAASKQNAPEIIKYMRKFDEEALKQEKLRKSKSQ